MSGLSAHHPESKSVERAISLLLEAQSITDSFDHPEIGARLQEIIDAVRDRLAGKSVEDPSGDQK